MQIDFTLSTREGEASMVAIRGYVRGGEILSLAPLDDVYVDDQGVQGSAIVLLPNDGYYRFSLSAYEPDGAYGVSTDLFFRVDQGNAHTIPEQIYLNAVEDQFVADVQSEAHNHAHRKLETLKPNSSKTPAN